MGYKVCGKRLKELRKCVVRLHKRRLISIGADRFGALIPKAGQDVEEVSEERPGMAGSYYRGYERGAREIPLHLIDSLRFVLGNEGFPVRENEHFETVLNGLREPDLPQEEWESALARVKPTYTIRPKGQRRGTRSPLPADAELERVQVIAAFCACGATGYRTTGDKKFDAEFMARNSLANTAIKRILDEGPRKAARALVALLPYESLLALACEEIPKKDSVYGMTPEVDHRG